MSEILVDVKHLYKSYDQGLVPALEDVTFRMERGKIYALTGPSGCGKSTLLHIIGTLDAPDSGDVVFADFMQKESAAILRSRYIGFVFQFHYLIPILTLRENIETAMLGNPSFDSKTRRTKANRLLKSLGLETKADRFANKVSGGERQRGAIARALANDPVLILADEPTGSVDSHTAQAILKALKAYIKEHDATMLIATHDPTVAAIADARIKMLDGKITRMIERT